MDDIILPLWGAQSAYDYSFDEFEDREEPNRQVVLGMPWEYYSAPNMIYGAPSSAKSAFTIALGAHAAAGVSFLGFEFTKKHNIYYVDYDGNNIEAVVSKFKRGYGLPLDGKFFRVTNAAVEQPRITKVNDEEFRQHYGNRIDAMRQATGVAETIVVFDTLNGLAPNVNESDAGAGQHLSNLTQLAKMDPDQKTCILVLHHKGKNNSSERGSSSIRATMASCMSIDCKMPNDRKIYTAEVNKDRIDPAGGWPELQFVFQDLAYRIDNRKPYASRIELATSEKLEDQETTSKVEQIRQFMTARIQGSRITDIADGLKMRKQSVNEIVRDFETKGLASMIRDGRRELWYYSGHDDRVNALIEGVRNSKNQSAAEGA